MKDQRYPEAEERFREAYARYASLAAKDTSNTELRSHMARASRKAGDACRAMAGRSNAPGERARWRASAAEWYSRSLALYRALAGAGSLAGAEAGAADEVASLLAAVR
jgi:hypothetical protein